MSQRDENLINLPSTCRDDIARAFDRGRLIAVCGIDGSGKTTLISALGARLRARGFDVETTRQPTDFYRTNIAVRAYHDTGEQMMWPEGIALLSACDRLLHLRRDIVPALDRGAIVLCDRYVAAAYAIFAARGLPVDWVEAINTYVPPAHMTLLLDLPATTAVERIARRGEHIRLEERSAAFLERVRQQYRHHAADAIVLDALQSADDLTDRAEAAILPVCDHLPLSAGA